MTRDQSDSVTHALYHSGPGLYEFAIERNIPLPDRKRGKTVPVRVTYPTAGGKHPVIIWSHGAFGAKDGYKPLVMHWASHGYICIQPTHSDSIALGVEIGDWRALDDWPNRPADIKLVLDSLPQIADAIPALGNRFDTEHIGVGGHSFGSHTASLIGGVTVHNPDGGGRQSFADLRPAAFMLISPQGQSRTIDAESWQSFHRPLMVLTGTNDTSVRTGKSYEWRLEAYELAASNRKYLAVINGAYHGFGGITGVNWPGAGPADETHVRFVKSLSLAFWDACLSDNQAAADFLRAASVQNAGGGQIGFHSQEPESGAASPQRKQGSSQKSVK
jgi:predicted dienelactone hydrolase